ncbi:MAG: hypothetical protein EBX52_00335, partial [Proteobacteria bacterium]|nr:hypothetical protein [Pseudomonadota bacterium]
SWNRLTRTLTFHDDDAHSWLEVHDPASGRWLRVDPTEWVLREIPEKESGDLWTGLPAGSAMVWVLLLVSGLLSVYLFRDPREQLLALFPAPEAEPLSARIRRHSSGTGKRAVLLDSVARDYEDLYYSPRGVTGKKLRLQLNILKLRILIRWSRTWS